MSSKRIEGAQPEKGMVSAELAMALPAVLIFLVVVLAGAMVGVDAIQCSNAARVGARWTARGESAAAAEAAAQRAAPEGARVSSTIGGGYVTVAVIGPPRLWNSLGLPGQAHGSASVPLEAVDPVGESKQ